jgi:hypothetical protein
MGLVLGKKAVGLVFPFVLYNSASAITTRSYQVPELPYSEKTIEVRIKDGSACPNCLQIEMLYNHKQNLEVYAEGKLDFPILSTNRPKYMVFDAPSSNLVLEIPRTIEVLSYEQTCYYYNPKSKIETAQIAKSSPFWNVVGEQALKILGIYEEVKMVSEGMEKAFGLDEGRKLKRKIEEAARRENYVVEIPPEHCVSQAYGTRIVIDVRYDVLPEIKRALNKYGEKLDEAYGKIAYHLVFTGADSWVTRKIDDKILIMLFSR